MLAAPRLDPRATPARSTTKVWPVMGTGVYGRGITSWAAPAVSRAKPITRAMLTTLDRGRTAAVITGEGTVVCTMAAFRRWGLRRECTERTHPIIDGWLVTSAPMDPTPVAQSTPLVPGGPNDPLDGGAMDDEGLDAVGVDHVVRRRRRVWPWVLAGFLLLVGVAAAISWPIKVPYYALSPGPVEDTSDYVSVGEPAGEPSEGELLFLTVSVRETNLLGYIGAMLAEEVDLAPRENIRPVGVSQGQLRRQNLDLMETSKDYAIFVALDRLGYDPELVGSGALVAQVVEGSAAEGTLELGDVVVAVDGQPVQFNSDATAMVAGHAPGDTIEITVERTVGEGETEAEDEVETLTFPITLTPFRFLQEDGGVEEDPERGMVGILLTNDEVSVDFPIAVTIDSQNIGGPSAGMMFSLEVYDQLSDGDLTAGYRIAGTGTIDINGDVGGIGAVRQKVFGAIAVGADYMLVPASNYEVAADAAGDDIDVIRIETIDDALAFLETLTPAT